MSETVDSVDDLPATIPVFPLSGVLLLPRGHLPLNIFEPRYRNMTRDALDSNRLIGMIQPVSPEEVPVTESGRIKNLDDERLSLYTTGCAGRIDRCQETPDGRYQFTLTGVCRFTLGAEIDTTRGYRRFEANWSSFEEDLTKEAKPLNGRDKMLDALKGYFEANNLSADWKVIGETEDEDLITALSMLSPFSPAEKQALLEASDLGARCEVLTAIAQMGAHDSSSEDLRPQ